MLVVVLLKSKSSSAYQILILCNFAPFFLPMRYYIVILPDIEGGIIGS